MEMMVLADTTFLIDLQRSSRNVRHRVAALWLSKNAEVEIALPAIVLGEFAEGFENDRHPIIDHYRSNHRIVEVDENMAMMYSRISRELRQQGRLIGGNDLWIAATALTMRVPLLTRNVNHFKRVRELEVIAYDNEGE